MICIYKIKQNMYILTSKFYSQFYLDNGVKQTLKRRFSFSINFYNQRF